MALSEFAQHLRYLPASHWSGSEPVRLMLTAADDPSVVHGTAESSWANITLGRQEENMGRCMQMRIHQVIIKAPKHCLTCIGASFSSFLLQNHLEGRRGFLR